MLLVLALVLAAASGGNDVVVLRSGKSLRGRVVFESAAVVVLRQDARDTRIERESIERVTSQTRDLRAVLDNAAKTDFADPRALELLVSQADEIGLAGESQAFWWRRLLLDPTDEAANRALGHKKRGQQWLIKFDGHDLSWQQRVEAAHDWGFGWQFTSLHYRLRSNLPLGTTLDILLDLERLYRAFFELFGAELELYDVCHPMTVHVHADAASYPENAGEFGRYEPLTDIVQVDFHDGVVFQTLAHELVHQLLYDTAFRERKQLGEQIPPWCNEGLAEYFATSVVRCAPLELDLGRPAAHHFSAHSKAKDPFDLTRVIAFSTGDYEASSDRDLKYAQSYTLVHFLLHGQKGARREELFEFLRDVYSGKGSATDLRRAVGTDWRKLEKEWSAHARDTRP